MMRTFFVSKVTNHIPITVIFLKMWHFPIARHQKPVAQLFWRD